MCAWKTQRDNNLNLAKSPLCRGRPPSAAHNPLTSGRVVGPRVSLETATESRRRMHTTPPPQGAQMRQPGRPPAYPTPLRRAVVVAALTACCLLLVQTRHAAGAATAPTYMTLSLPRKSQQQASGPVRPIYRAHEQPPSEAYPESHTTHMPPLEATDGEWTPMKEEDKPRLYYHEGWQTCTVEGSNMHSMNGRYYSLGPPAKEFGGVQIFGRDHLIRSILPHQLLFIPAAANEAGNFDRWAIFNSFSIPSVPLGRADHSQIFHTTRESNGTVWEVHLNERAYRAALQGDDSFLKELQTLVPPVGAPRCEPGHIVGPSDRILRVSRMRAPEEAGVLIEEGISPRAQVMNRARLECQAFSFSFTEHSRAVSADTAEALLAGKAACRAALAQPDAYIGPTKMFALRMGAAHHDMLTRHLPQAAELYVGIINTFVTWDVDNPLQISGRLTPNSTYHVFHDLIPTLIQDRQYETAERMYEQMLYSPMFQEARDIDRNGAYNIQHRIDNLLPLVKLRLGKYSEAARILAVTLDGRYTHDFVTGFLLEWTVQQLLRQGDNVTDYVRAAYDKVRAAYSDQVDRGVNLYDGFVPPSPGWQPRRFERLPTPAEMADYVRRREPFIVDPPRNPAAFGAGGCVGLPGTCPIEDVERDCPPLLKMLGWEKVCTWDAARLCEVSGNKQVSLALRSHGMGQMDTFSGSTTNSRNFTSFCAYASEVLDPESPSRDLSRSVGYFDAGSANSISGGVTHIDDQFARDFPLDRLAEDIPLPNFLRQQPGSHPTENIVRKEFANETILKMYSATWWMGSAAQDDPGQCGLHYDALDNFHVLVSGHKKWKIYSPADAMNMDYVLPVLNVTDGGDLFQFEWDGDLKVFNLQTRFSKVSTVHQGTTDLIRRAHPRLARSTQFEFDIEGGSAVYLPGGWAHDISSHGIYQSITHWFFRNHFQIVALEGQDRVDEITERLDNPPPRLNLSQLFASKEWQPDALATATV